MPFSRPTVSAALEAGKEVRYAAVALPVFPKAGEWQIALMKRTEYPGVHSGQISIPGGEVEAGDIDLTFTACREFREEMGVTLPPDSIISGLSDRYIPPSQFAVTTFIAVLEAEPCWNVDADEVANVLVMPISQLLHSNALVSTAIQVQKGVRVDLPAYHYADEVIWGATAIILTEFAFAWRALLHMD